MRLKPHQHLGFSEAQYLRREAEARKVAGAPATEDSLVREPEHLRHLPRRACSSALAERGGEDALESRDRTASRGGTSLPRSACDGDLGTRRDKTHIDLDQ